MRPKPIILATRAISSEFIRREYSSLLWIVGGALVIFHILGIWLISQSTWWWLLEGVFILLTAVAIVACGLAVVAIKLLRPTQTKNQRKMIKKFVGSLQEIADTAQTPKFVLLFRLFKDILLPSQDSLVGQITSKATSLKPELQEIVRSFDK